MSSDRLNELRRQREAIQAHLHWLDSEIARESTQLGPAAPMPVAAKPSVDVPSTSALIDYEPDPVSAAADARKGCLIWVLALVLLGLALVTAIYFWRYRDHPLFMSPPEAAAAASSANRKIA